MNAMSVPRLHTWALLSIVAAVVTMVLKLLAWWLTGSVGLLSDALESLVNLAAATVAYFSLRYADRPADREHTYGHEKIEFFSSGLEGGLILVAALAIAWAAVERLLYPRPLEPLGPGLGVSLLATLINGGVAFALLRVAHREGSIVLEADGKHLLTDVWTSVGVLAGLALVWLTGREMLDPLIALGVAVNILWTAGNLMLRSYHGLMDRALPEEELRAVRAAIESRLGPDMTYHALRTRKAGRRRFVDFHLLVPGALTVRAAHDLTNAVEDAMRAALAELEVTVHIEPIEERSAWEDSALLELEGQTRPGRDGGGSSPAAPTPP
jgi:cation diffusion facilitator family transporter